MRQSERGFTLTELLVVIALIAVLAGLLLPVFSRVRRQAQSTVCLARLQQWSHAHQLYVQDYDEKLPSWVTPMATPPGSSEPPRYWTEYLRPYGRCDTLRDDPAATWAGDPPTEYRVLAGYSLLTWPQSGRRGDRWEPSMRWPGPPFTVAHVVRPSETIQWTDGWTTTRWSLGAVTRHGRGMNAAFVDGHARWLSNDEFWRVTAPDERGYFWLHYGAADR